MTLWHGKWENRGFLFGPVIPIYGFCALMGTLLFDYGIKEYTPTMVFLISVISSAVVEYSVHYLLEKLFNAYWWDYSKAPFNINGRVCLPASLGFGIAGLLIIYKINPLVWHFLNQIKDNALQLFSVILTVIFTADVTTTISVISDFEDRVSLADNFINEHMEQLLSNVIKQDKTIADRFYGAMDKIEDTRQKIVNERAEKIVSSMNGVYHSAISRIKGFRHKGSERLNNTLNIFKEKADKFRKRK